MHPDSQKYNDKQSNSDREICNVLANIIEANLPDAENKMWHAHPVWFLDGNPIVGYGKLKNCVRLLFWSGQSFKTEGLKNTGSFKAAEARFTSVDAINVALLKKWLAESSQIQWDYKNIIKRKGQLEKLC